MYSVVRTFEFEAAHRLMMHEGCCSNIHGHSYKVEIKLCSDVLSEIGMILDFSRMKMVFGTVIDKLDHAIILNAGDFKLISFCKESKYKWCEFEGDPTVENMAKILFENFDKEFNEVFVSDKISVKRVTVWETSKCKASYTIE